MHLPRPPPGVEQPACAARHRPEWPEVVDVVPGAVFDDGRRPLLQRPAERPGREIPDTRSQELTTVLRRLRVTSSTIARERADNVNVRS